MEAERRSLSAPRTACLALTALALSFAPATAAKPAGIGTASSVEPVILVHGYAVISARGHDCSEYWESAIDAIGQWLPGRFELLGAGFYGSDTNCPAVIDDGATNDTPIEDLGYRLAWYVYDHYSSQGRSVDLVGHAMGGHVIRYALSRFEAGDPAFPPTLLVDDAVTISTGHAGDLLAADCLWSYECRELVPGSPFLATLGANPQGTAGTDWTVIGSYCDPAVTPESASAMDAYHRFLYSSPCYGHVNAIQDASTELDATYDRSENRGAWTAEGGAPHSLRLLAMALDDATADPQPPGPPPQSPPSPEAQLQTQPDARCTVPRLRGRSTRKARALIAREGCRLGRVLRPRVAKSSARRHGHRGHLLRVVRQSVVAGSTIGAGNAIDLRLGWRHPKRGAGRHARSGLVARSVLD